MNSHSRKRWRWIAVATVLLGVFVFPSLAEGGLGLTCSSRADLAVGAIGSLTLGPELTLSWEPDAADMTVFPCRLEASVNAGRFLGWQVGGGLAALWVPLGQRGWVPALGIAARVTAGSGFTLGASNQAATAGYPDGPLFMAGPGLIIAPLDFRFAHFDLSLFRLETDLFLAANIIMPRFVVSVFALRLYLEAR